MKRLYANRPGWRRVTRRRFFSSHLNTPEYRGYVTLLCMDGVRQPLWVELAGRRTCIVDAGFSWLQHFPANEHYAVTTMFDADGQIVQWYIDICREHGVGERNIPWLDDLYLDIVVLPPMETLLLDADDLADALRNGDITQADYDLAWREANRLTMQIERTEFALLALCPVHRQVLLQTLPIERDDI